MSVVAEVCDGRVRARLRTAAPLKLHDDTYWRTDGNSPIIVDRSRVLSFFSSYEPRGHTLRRVGDRSLNFTLPSSPVRLVDDPAPHVGKWIEAVWRDPARGVLHGWYHAEEAASCSTRRFVPHVGELESEDEGSTWRWRGEVLRAPAGEIDCSWQNGAVVGGYGDLCVVPDRMGRHLYLAFTSYRTSERAQGIGLARMPRARSGPPATDLELWTRAGWQPASDAMPQPLWPQARGWRHADPDGFWGPAIHFNRVLDSYVMLIVRTAGGAGDLRTEGIYVSVNPTLADPMAWTRPLQLVRGGGWYPQVVGLDDGCGDTEAGAAARFFMAGFSAWTLEFSHPEAAPPTCNPLRPTAADFMRLFGTGKCPW
jgi:hypothetical protein